MRTVVAGSGIFGATAALELARRGHTVTLLDAGDPPRPEAASTDVSKLVRADYGDDPFHVALMERAFEGWSDWNARAGRPLFHRTGLLLLAADWRPGGFEHDSFAVLGARGHAVEEVAPPAPWRGFSRAYVSRGAGWAESGAVVGEVVGWAVAAGVSLWARCPLQAVEERGGRVVAVRAGGRRLEADAVVVATGAWTPRVWPELADRLRAVGQVVLHLRPADPAPFQVPAFLPWCADIARTGFYGFAAAEAGFVKVAHHGRGEVVDPERAPAPRPDQDAPFRTFLRTHLPALADAEVVHRRTCPYSDSFDGRFFVDRHPSIAGLVVSTGGSGHGFKFAPVLGALAADALEGTTAPELAWRPLSSPRSEAARSPNPR